MPEPVNPWFTSTVSVPGGLVALRTEFKTLPSRIRGAPPLKAIPSPTTIMMANAETTIFALGLTNWAPTERSGKKYHSGRSIC